MSLNTTIYMQSLARQVDGIEYRISSLDLEPIKFKLHHDNPTVWTLERLDHAEISYKRFLILIGKNPGVRIVPAGDIDSFWHAHILDTAKYAADCEKIFGFFLHHFPYSGLVSEKDAEQHRASFEATRKLWFQEFGSSYLPGTKDAACDDCAPDTDSPSAGLALSERPRPRLGIALADFR